MQLISKFGQYLQQFIYNMVLKMTVLTRRLIGDDNPEVNISDLVFTYYR